MINSPCTTCATVAIILITLNVPATAVCQSVQQPAADETGETRNNENDQISTLDLSDSFRPISEISLKPDSDEGSLPEPSLQQQPISASTNRALITPSIHVHWAASGLYSQPSYFEDISLERYGHTYSCPLVQSLVSGSRFFGTIPILPCKMGLNCPNECIYTLGFDRPGNCTCPVKEHLPCNKTAPQF